MRSQTRLLALLAATMLFLLIEVSNATTISCSANCKTCWGSGANQCMSCDTNYILLQDFSCVLESGNSCATGYAVDNNDKRCKRTITDIDYPCEPSTYNQNTGASTVSSCQVCSPGEACENFAKNAPTSDCLAGFYCKTKATLRTPIKEYASDWSSSPSPPPPISGVTNFWKYQTTPAVGSPYTVGDICQKGNFCPKKSTDMTSCYA
eukprot:CAMPEP_0170471830 /NCGR_PEP_ID=MMETSP0123-20130129/13986_1 /TAXON_ID=182087 /ORGANISM="Favella ehrenbergii, Strain Fehren 1" /LENGTH=206 /DNA_ID=CAMNT_0010739743 /DNA_START=137 /DNA_END=754 /DNA_ORIENTATION=-